MNLVPADSTFTVSDPAKQAFETVDDDDAVAADKVIIVELLQTRSVRDSISYFPSQVSLVYFLSVIADPSLHDQVPVE